MQPGAQAHEAGLVNRVRRRDSMPLRQREPVAHVGLRIAIYEPLLALRNIRVGRDVGRSGIDDRPLDQPRFNEFVDGGEALLRRELFPRIDVARKRERTVANDVALRADAFDDGRVDLVIVALAPARRVLI